MKKSKFITFLSAAILSISLFSFVSALETPYTVSSMPTPITPVDTADDLPGTSCVQLTTSLVFGSKDSTTNGQVSDLQFFLSNKGYLRTDPTGYFGVATLAAVKAFQSDNGITPNGVVGPLTRGKIISLTCTNTEPTPTEINPQNTWNPHTGGTTNGGNNGGTNETVVPTTSLPQAMNGLSVNLSFAGTGGNGASASVTGGGTLQNVDPMRIRTWTWTSTGAAAVSARYVISGPNCNASSFSNVAEENWQPWSGAGITGTRFSGSNSRVLGQAYFGCTITATYTARNTSGGVVASTVRVSFKGPGVSANLPDSNPLYYCNGVIQHEPCTTTGGVSGGSSTGPTGPIMTCLYAAPRPGCTYVPGPNYNPNTTCGMVESCTGGVTDTPGATLNLTPSSLPTGSLYALYASCPSSSNSSSMKIEYQSNGQYVSRGCMNVTSYTTSAIGAGQEIGTASGSLVPGTFPTSVGTNNYRLTCYSGVSCSGNVTATKNTPLTVISSGSSGGTGSTGGATSSCPTGTVPLMVLGVQKCGPVGGVCPAGTVMVGLLTATPTCSPSTGTGSGSGTGTTGGSGSSGPAATGISCYQDNLYSNGTLSMTCPKAPNGGIACQVNPSDSSKTGCAGDGYVWVNGNRFQWRGNTSGACYADSSCETNYVCGTVSKRCEPKVEYSYDYGVTGAPSESGVYKRTWGGTAWGPWVFIECRSGFHSEGSAQNCVSSVRTCTTTGGSGRQTYSTGSSSWGSCVVDTCTAGNVLVFGTCKPAKKSCTPINPYPTTYPRGSSVATGYQSIVTPITTDIERYLYDSVCQIECKSGYTKETVQASTLGLDYFQLSPDTTSSALEYCVPSYDTLVSGDLTIPPIVTTDYKVSWSTDTGGISKTVSCKVQPGKSTCDLTATWSSRNATSGSLTKNGTSVGTGGTSGSYRFTIQPNNTDTLVLTLQPGNVRRTNIVVAECETGIWNGSVCTTEGGSSGGIASGSITGGRCTVSIGMSSCATSVSWTSSNASAVSVNKFDNSGSSLLSNERNGATTITGLTPSDSGKFVRLQVEPGPTGPVRYSVNLVAECAAGSAWNNSTCAPTAGGGGSGSGGTGSGLSCSGPAPTISTTVSAGNYGGVWGTGPFTTDSNYGSIAKFLGGTGMVTLSATDLGCRSSFAGGTANGITTQSYGTFRGMNVSCVSGCSGTGTGSGGTGGGGGTPTASCSVTFTKTNFFNTEESEAVISSTGLSRVEQSTNSSPYYAFTTKNGTQVFPPMYFVPNSYFTIVRGIPSDGSAPILCSVNGSTGSSISFTVKP